MVATQPLHGISVTIPVLQMRQTIRAQWTEFEPELWFQSCVLNHQYALLIEINGDDLTACLSSSPVGGWPLGKNASGSICHMSCVRCRNTLTETSSISRALGRPRSLVGSAYRLA